MLFCLEFESHDLQLVIVLVVLQLNSLVEFGLGNFCFFFVFLFQLLVALFIDFCLKQIGWTSDSSLERDLVVHSVSVFTLVDLGWRFTFGNVGKLWHLSALPVPLIFAVVSI